jgi:hypothetical protein
VLQYEELNDMEDIVAPGDLEYIKLSQEEYQLRENTGSKLPF